MPCCAAGVEDRRAGGDRDRDAVDRQLDVRRRLDRRRHRRPRRPGRRAQEISVSGWAGRAPGRRAGVCGSGAGSRLIDRPRVSVAHSATSSGCRRADSIADDAVWPSPQIDASRIAWPISRSRTSSSSRERDARARREPREQLLLAHAADPARDALAARLVAEELGDPPQRVDEVDGLVEDHDHARAEGRRRRPASPRR